MSSVLGGYQPPPQPVERVIQGVLAGVEPRNNGWRRFAIQEPGRQYPIKVDTKKPEVIDQAMALMGQMVSAAIREQQSDSINPHNNQPYINRYLNEIAAAGHAQNPPPQQVQQPQPVPFPQQAARQQTPQEWGGGLTGAEKDLDIHRQLAWKGACWMAAAGKIESTPRALVEAAEVGMAYITYGPLRFGVQPFSADGGAQHEPGGGSEYNPAYARVDGQVPAANDDHPFNDPLPPGQGSSAAEQGDVCLDCGYLGGDHAYGCPRGPSPYTG
jgi:hypothetical protein